MLLIAPGETYDFLLRPEQAGDMKITFDLVLLKEEITQAIDIVP
jgi:hypothetical protein